MVLNTNNFPYKENLLLKQFNLIKYNQIKSIIIYIYYKIKRLFNIVFTS